MGVSTMGQDGSVVVEVKDGNLPESIPTGKPIIIKGSSIFGNNEMAKIIYLDVIDTKLEKISSYKWLNESNSNDFEINVDALYPGVPYKLEMRYYKEQTIDQKIANGIIDSVRGVALDIMRKNHGISLSVLDSLTQIYIDTIGKDNPANFYLENEKVVEGVNFKYPTEWLKYIMNTATDEVIYRMVMESISTDYTDFRQLLISNLSNKDTLSEDSELRKVVQSDTYFDLEDDEILSELDEYENLSVILKEDLEYILEQEAQLIERKKDYQNSIEALDDIEKVLKESKQLSVHKLTKSYKDFNVTGDKSSADQLGLRYGVGYSSIGWDDNLLFHYAVARYYLFPIDKSMSSPYHRNWNKLAINIGAVIGDLNYKGQELHDVSNLGLKLLTGISYDLSEDISANMGLLWFDYNPGEPFDDVNRTKASAYVGLSFDINLIENIKK
jgi:hypothetical protein